MAGTNKTVPRTADREFSWLTREHGAQWEAWRRYAAEWLALQHSGVDGRLHALRTLLGGHLTRLNLPAEPAWFLGRAVVAPDLYEVSCPKSIEGVKYNNYVHDFLAWVLEHYFSGPDDHGRPVQLPEYHKPGAATIEVGPDAPHGNCANAVTLPIYPRSARHPGTGPAFS